MPEPTVWIFPTHCPRADAILTLLGETSGCEIKRAKGKVKKLSASRATD